MLGENRYLADSGSCALDVNHLLATIDTDSKCTQRAVDDDIQSQCFLTGYKQDSSF